MPNMEEPRHTHTNQNEIKERVSVSNSETTSEKERLFRKSSKLVVILSRLYWEVHSFFVGRSNRLLLDSWYRTRQIHFNRQPNTTILFDCIYYILLE